VKDKYDRAGGGFLLCVMEMVLSHSSAKGAPMNGAPDMGAAKGKDKFREGG